MHRGRLKIRLLSYAVGMAAAVAMIVAGILIVIPDLGHPGVLWTSMAVFILANHVYGLIRTLRGDNNVGARG